MSDHGPMYLNLVHKLEPKPSVIEAVRFQLAEAKRYNLKATLLANYSALYHDECVALMLQWQQETDGELGIHFHALDGPDFSERFNSRERAIYLQPRDKKEAIIAALMERFTEIFEYVPHVVGSYILDAWTLNHIHSRYPEVKAAITNCFEEGVKMYQGNNHAWTLFSDGGPWGPFYPSKSNALCPARNEDEWNGIVALPHLTRDMIMALASRDDLFCSHPGNLFRARVNEGAECPYMFRFIDHCIEQAQWNGLFYYNLFVSGGWLTEEHWSHDDPSEVRSLYSANLAYLAKRRDEGAVKDVTMEAFAQVFREKTAIDQPQACLWNDQVTLGKRQMFWFVNAEYRAAFDLNVGGTLCDLRPYSGRIDGDMGPDTPSLWNGSHPFVVSAELRAGHDRTHLSCAVRIGEAEAWISDRRTRARVERHDNTWTLAVDPVTLQVGDHRVTLVSELRFDTTGVIRIRRTVTECEPSVETIELRESFRGTWGKLEYAEDMTSITLSAQSRDGEEVDLAYTYDSPPITIENAASVKAKVPPAGSTVSLSAAESETASLTAYIADGTLFTSTFEMSLTKQAKVGDSLETNLTISAL